MVGMNVYEREAADANRIVPSDIFTFGAVFKSRRGPVGVAYPIGSINEDKAVYGEFAATFLGGYIRRGLFNNCKEFGAIINGARVVPSDAVAANKTFKHGVTDTWKFTSAVLGHISPGADGNNVKVQLKVSVVDATHMDVLVFYKGPKDTDFVLKETWEYLDATTVADKITRNSYYVKCDVLDSSALPDAAAATALALGVDGVVALDDDDYSAAYALFNGLPVSAIFNCDQQTLTAAQALQTYVEGRANTVGVIASPSGMVQATLITTYQALLKAKSFIAGYRGWGKVDSEFGGVVSIPMIGHSLGAGWVRKCRQRGGYPWVAPAGDSTSLTDVLELEFPSYDDADLNALVDGGWNPVQFIPGAGFIVRTSRLFSTMRKYYSIHVRRFTNWLIMSFRNSFLWVEQEPNNEKTRSRVVDSLTFFSRDCWNNGAFRTRGGYDNNVRIKCDDENNTETMEDNGELLAEYVFHPVECVQSGQINIYQTRDDLIVSEQ